jgi:hypothetical protein
LWRLEESSGHVSRYACRFRNVEAVEMQDVGH